MLLKNKIVFEVEINDKIIILNCDPDAPLGSIHDALCQMKSYIVDKIVSANQKIESDVEDAPKD